MRAIFLRAATAALALFVGVVVYHAGCGEDKGTGPEPAAKKYPIYFMGATKKAGDKICYRYFPATRELDSFNLPVWPDNYISVSSDGSEIWISGSDRIYIYDLSSESIKKELTYNVGGAAVVFSPDGRLATIYEEGNLYIINADDYSVLFHDSEDVLYGWFGIGQFIDNGNKYITHQYPDYIYQVDLGHDCEVSRIQVEGIGAFERMLPSEDGRKYFIITRVGIYHSGFFVYDKELDSLVFSCAVAPQPARIKTSPCGRYVYLTAGGTLNSVHLPPFSFAIYDAEANRIIEEVEIPIEELPDYYMPLDRIVITPDGRHLFGTWIFMSDCLPAYDLLQKDTVEILRFEGKDCYNICCQNGL